ncbi:DUF1501 domain-containing protein [Planctomycetales bacterium 10988]|nr:DUF1501 domain-containing protein [Planctomycetales bacterium 10988]
MLNVLGKASTYCDGISRREMLRAGVLGLGGLSLADLLRLRAHAKEAPEKRHQPSTSLKSVIFVEMAGGPSHFETYDPKPEAPEEFRGPLRAVPTKIPGIRFCETMSRQAQIADKMVVIRSVSHGSGSHQSAAHLTQTGYFLQDNQARENEMPCIGSIVSRLSEGGNPELPAYISIQRQMRYGGAAYLGKSFNPFETGGNPAAKRFQIQNLQLHRSLSFERLQDRRHLLAALDQQRQVLDLAGSAEAMDDFSRQAFAMITGKSAQEAFDLSLASEAERDSYGRSTLGQSFLLARRLVEAGVPFVTLRSGGWDDHNQIEQRITQRGAEFDQGMSQLILDLIDRGLFENTLVVAMGEFGRTPKVNRTAGRDHWGNAMNLALAGGSFRMGQVIGSTDRKGEAPLDRPLRPEQVLAMIYYHLGINPEQTIIDHAGRPRYLLEHRELIPELLG